MLALGRSSSLVERHEMLRHNEFHQFGRMVLGKESSPHEVHWAIRDILQDSGATIDKETEVDQSAHWTMTQDSHVGQKDGCESDYVTFHGAVLASKGKHLPAWLRIVLVLLGVLGLMMAAEFPVVAALFFLSSLGCAIYAYWLKKYQRGNVYARYEGVYRRPDSGAQTAAGVQTWEFQLDLMLSYKVEIPPFGLKALGPEVVQPVFEAAKQNVLHYAHSGVAVARIQPQLLSSNPADYSERFPVQFVE